MPVPSDIVRQIRNGNRVVVARSISMVENEHPDAVDLLKQVYPLTGNAYRIGITGPPGAGNTKT